MGGIPTIQKWVVYGIAIPTLGQLRIWWRKNNVIFGQKTCGNSLGVVTVVIRWENHGTQWMRLDDDPGVGGDV